jgi:hypothetical protein
VNILHPERSDQRDLTDNWDEEERHVCTGEYMTDNGERTQSGGLSSENQIYPADRGNARRAWVRPHMCRISLQRTLAGSSDASDIDKEVSAIPT